MLKQASGDRMVIESVDLSAVAHLDWHVRPFSRETLTLTFWSEDPLLSGSRYSMFRLQRNLRAELLGSVTETTLLGTKAHRDLIDFFQGREGVSSTIALATLMPHLVPEVITFRTLQTRAYTP